MAHLSKLSKASAIALAIGLTACGGGGGGSGIASMPPPPAAPPTPQPPPSPPGVVGAAAMGAVPNAAQFPPGVNGGPTMQAHMSTRFPLLQSVVTIGGGRASANLNVMNSGATLSFESIPPSPDHNFQLSVPELGFSDLAMVAGGYYCYTLCNYAGNQFVELNIFDPSTTGALNWTTFGSWQEWDSGANSVGQFVTGYVTPAASIPTTGTAAYIGSVDGQVVHPAPGGASFTRLGGLAELEANFASGRVSGNLTNMLAGGQPWNSVSLLGSIAGGQNGFSGTSAVTSVPGGTLPLIASATGTFTGKFFGPGAQELGAIWTLFDGNATAFGSIAAKKGP